MKETRFKKCDKVTYKKKKDCINQDGNEGYYYGGKDQGGFVGKVIGNERFNQEMGCYEIRVTMNDKINYYLMLECEFEEYDTPKSNELFPIY